MCMQFQPCTPNPQGQGGQNGLLHIHENFIKQKLKWTFQVGQCIMYDPLPQPLWSGGPRVPYEAMNRTLMSF